MVAQQEDQYPPEETDRRRDDALRRALNMPAAPQEAMKVSKVKRNAGRSKPSTQPRMQEHEIGD